MMHPAGKVVAVKQGCRRHACLVCGGEEGWNQVHDDAESGAGAA